MRIKTYRMRIIFGVSLLLAIVLLLVNVVNYIILSSILQEKNDARKIGKIRATAESFDNFLVKRRQAISEFFYQQEALFEAYHAEQIPVAKGKLAWNTYVNILRFCQANPDIEYVYFYLFVDNRSITNVRVDSDILNSTLLEYFDEQPESSLRGISLINSAILDDIIQNPSEGEQILCASLWQIAGQNVIMLCAINPKSITDDKEIFTVCDVNDNYLWKNIPLDNEDKNLDQSTHSLDTLYNPNESEWQYFFSIDETSAPPELNLFMKNQLAFSIAILLCIIPSVIFFSSRIMNPILSLSRRFDLVHSFGHDETSAMPEPGQNLRLHTRLQILFAGHVLLPVLVMQIVLSFYFNDALASSVEHMTLEDANSTATNIAHYLEEISLLIDDIALSSSVQQFLSAREGVGVNYGEIIFPLHHISILNVEKIKVLDTEQRLVASSGIDIEGRYVESIQPDLFSWHNTYPVWRWQNNYAELQYTVTKSVRRKIPSEVYEQADRDSFYQIIGYIEAVVPSDVLSSIYTALRWDDNMQVMILDDKDNIISHPIKYYVGKPLERLLGDIFPDGLKEHMRYEITIEHMNSWRLLLITPISLWTTDNVYGVLFNSIMFTVLLVLIWIISYIFASLILWPITSLQKQMTLVQAGDTSIRINIQSHGNEVDQLCETFNHMMDRLQSLVEENLKTEIAKQEAEAKTHLLERSKKEMELVALQSQINPHFIYNTISSISFMMSMGRLDEANEMLSALSRLFRVGMYRGSVIVRLEEELDHVKAYLSIQKFRYGDKLSYIIDVPPSLLQYGFIKLTLQPLVENAVYHGLEVKKSPGCIWIQGRIDLNRKLLYITIRDNGIGIDNEQLDIIRSRLDITGQFSEHIGIQNVLNRIRLYYGNEYGLDVDSEVNKGTCITLKIPLIVEPLIVEFGGDRHV